MTVNLVSIYQLAVGLRDRFDPKNIRITCVLYLYVYMIRKRMWSAEQLVDGRPKRVATKCASAAGGRVSRGKQRSGGAGRGWRARLGEEMSGMGEDASGSAAAGRVAVNFSLFQGSVSQSSTTSASRRSSSACTSTHQA